MDDKAPAGTVSSPWRALFPRHNDLRRGSDRLELAARWTVLFTVLLLVPFVLAFGSTVADDAEHRGAIARAARHPVTATVVAPPRDRSAAAGRTGDVERATVRWVGRDGLQHVGSTQVFGDVPPGSATGMWVDDAEHPVTRPPAPGDGATAGALAASVLFATVVILAFLGLRAVGWLLDRRRLRGWEREWEVIGQLGRGSAR